MLKDAINWLVAKPEPAPDRPDYLGAVEAGRQAALAGKDHWENPHCLGDSELLMTQAWYGGWLRGKQEAAKSIDNWRKGP